MEQNKMQGLWSSQNAMLTWHGQYYIALVLKLIRLSFLRQHKAFALVGKLFIY